MHFAGGLDCRPTLCLLMTLLLPTSTSHDGGAHNFGPQFFILVTITLTTGLAVMTKND